MEKRSPLILLFLLISIAAFSQEISILEKIRMPVWAELDAYPQLKEAQNTKSDVYEYPVSRIKELSKFLITGMTYGWEFSYTPYDKARKVEEFFEVTPIHELSESDGKIEYSDPWFQDNNFNCWIDFQRTPQMIREYKLWQSVNFDRIKGYGFGSIAKGFDGITEAAENALKDAIRNHYRKIIKNKPKEIRGRVIIRKLPKIGINQGRYKLDLDFFLESTKIIMYTCF